jgi:hypothetical protein
MLSRSSKRFHLPSFMVLAWLALGLASACSKKEKEPLAAEDQPPAKAAVAARPTPARALAKCDPEPDGKCKPSPTCSPDCKPIATPDCVKCEAGGDCAPFANNCESPLLSEADKKICYEIQTCVETSRCFEGAKTTLGSCYCGNLDLKSCLAAPMSGPGAPAGACHDVILKGMPNAKNQSHVLGNLTTRDRAAGLALSRLNCQKVGYKQTCASVCGWLPG